MSQPLAAGSVLPDLPYSQFGAAVTLTNCDLEPIHIPGHSQAHGVIIALDPGSDELNVVQVSENIEVMCGLLALDVVGKCAVELFGLEVAEILSNAISALPLDGNPVYLFTSPINGFGPFHAIVHIYDGVLIVEIEPVANDDQAEDDFAIQQGARQMLRKALLNLRKCSTTVDYCQTVCRAIHEISGFDRVMAYKFHEDGHGEVIAEVIGEADEREPYLGLHYPASDIPRQARALFMLNSIRMMPDAQYMQAAIVPLYNPATQRPLDMTHCALRGYSRMYTEYLTNMGSRASMSLAIVSNDRLWGLIACHHQSYRAIPYDERASCEVLIDVVSLQIADRLRYDEKEYVDQMGFVHQLLVDNMQAQDNILAGLSTPFKSDTLVTALSLFNAGGCAVVGENMCRLLGKTPPESAVPDLVHWLQTNQTMRDDVFATDNLAEVYPAAAAFRDSAAGLLALCLSQDTPKTDWVLWFRPEEAQTVTWGGDPAKPFTTAVEGENLSPRKSFALWRETVTEKSFPWTQSEIDGARRLRAAVSGQDTSRRATELGRLNVELARSNVELDSFAYAASHDLKEPIRGINNYIRFLREDDGDQLNADAEQKLDTVVRLTQRMDTLLNSLLHYSQLGRQTLTLVKADLNVVLSEVMESLGSSLTLTGTELIIDRRLPVSVLCDVVQVNELLTNLISNAIKYNDKPSGKRRIEIAWTGEASAASPTPPYRKSDGKIIFSVQDNGIGIAERYFDTVFRIFKRLHGRTEFGGGTGAGLTICQRIIERHKGHIWVESIVGESTTFFFTLGWDPREA